MQTVISAQRRLLIEVVKLSHDLLKHITTLSTGLIVVLVIFIDKLFPDPIASWLVGVIFLLIMSTILSAIRAMGLLSSSLHFEGEDFFNIVTKSHFWNAVCGRLFFSAMLTLAIFGLINFYFK